MFNPLIDNFSDLSDSDLDNKITDLSRKYWQTRNPQVQEQIATILEMLKQESRLRREKSFQKQQDEDNGLDNLINVS